MPLERPDIILIGFSGNGREAFETIEEKFRVVAFVDDRVALYGTLFAGVPVLSADAIGEFPDAKVICLIGSAASFRKRAQVIERFTLLLSRYASVISARAHVSRFSQIGKGILLFPGVSIMADARIGNHVIILPNSIVHHDSVIGDYTLIGSGAIIAGNVTVGEGCYLGAGCTIRNGVQIGAGALVGMGSNVLSDVAPGQVVAGNPARDLQQTKARLALGGAAVTGR